MNIELFGVAVVASFVVAKLIEAIVTPLWVRAGFDRFWLLYVALVIGAGLGWCTGINALPVFIEQPMVGRVLTCLFMGLGPSAIYDLLDRPEAAP